MESIASCTHCVRPLVQAAGASVNLLGLPSRTVSARAQALGEMPPTKRGIRVAGGAVLSWKLAHACKRATRAQAPGQPACPHGMRALRDDVINGVGCKRQLVGPCQQHVRRRLLARWQVLQGGTGGTGLDALPACERMRMRPCKHACLLRIRLPQACASHPSMHVSDRDTPRHQIGAVCKRGMQPSARRGAPWRRHAARGVRPPAAAPCAQGARLRQR